MKILLVLPAYNRIGGYDSSSLHLMPPLGVQVVAALTPNDVEVQIIDENVEKICFDNKYDLVGISSVTTTTKRAYEISNAFRAKGVKVIMGGIQPTILPGEASHYCDSVCMGEAENVWHQVISDIRAGKLAKVYKAEDPCDLMNYPKINNNLIRREAYVCPDTIETSRGCPFSCDFCSISIVYGKRYKHRPIEDVVNQIIDCKSKYVSFVDDNIVGDFDRAKELFSSLAKLKIRWGAQASLNIASDDELLYLAKKSGCMSLFIGIESHEEMVLRDVNKSPNVKINREEAIKKIQRNDISVFASFVFGFDSESDGIFNSSLKFINKANPQFLTVAALTPFPGTKLFDQMKAEGRLRDNYWLDDNWFLRNAAPLSLKNYSDKEQNEGLKYILKNFYSYRSIIKRIIITRKNIMYALAMSFGLRSAALKFQDRRNIIFPVLGKIYRLFRTLRFHTTIFRLKQFKEKNESSTEIMNEPTVNR